MVSLLSGITSVQLAVLLAGFTFVLVELSDGLRVHDKGFALWKRQFQKSYASKKEEKRRLKIYRENDAEITKLNAEFKGETVFGHNQFSDLTPSEFSQIYLTLVTEPQGLTVGSLKAGEENGHETHGDDDDDQEEGGDEDEQEGGEQDDTDFGDNLMKNWTAEGAVTPVKNQGACGSCWAFTAVGAVESAYAIKYKKQKVLSEQELLDCVYNTPEMPLITGNGGRPDYALTYVARNGGISLEANYPYKAKAAKCAPKKPKYGKLSIAFTEVASTDKAIVKAVQGRGPLSIGVAAGDFRFYKSGFMRCRSSTPITHAVLLTGYEVTDTERLSGYYMVKNSWGATWGEQGYLRLPFGWYGDKNSTNNCGVLNPWVRPIYPTVA